MAPSDRKPSPRFPPTPSRRQTKLKTSIDSIRGKQRHQWQLQRRVEAFPNNGSARKHGSMLVHSGFLISIQSRKPKDCHGLRESNPSGASHVPHRQQKRPLNEQASELCEVLDPDVRRANSPCLALECCQSAIRPTTYCHCANPRSIIFL